MGICTLYSLLLSPCRIAFQSVMKSMLNVGYEEEEIVAMVALLAGVILIGDIVSFGGIITIHCTSHQLVLHNIMVCRYALIKVHLNLNSWKVYI